MKVGSLPTPLDPLGLSALKKQKEPRGKESRSFSFVTRLAPFLNNLPVRLFVAAIVALVSAQLIGDSLEDALVPATATALAQRLAAEIKANKPEMARMLEVCRQYGITFCYITRDKDPARRPKQKHWQGILRF